MECNCKDCRSYKHVKRTQRDAIAAMLLVPIYMGLIIVFA